MPSSWYHLAINLAHENVRGQGTKYISWTIKMLRKGQKSTLRIFMAHKKFPVKGIIMTHEFSIPLNCHEFAHREKSGYVSWPFPEHHENPITSQIHESLKKVMAFSCVFHCTSYNLVGLFHGGPLIVNFSKYFHSFFNGNFIG